MKTLCLKMNGFIFNKSKKIFPYIKIILGNQILHPIELFSKQTLSFLKIFGNPKFQKL